MIIKYSRNPVLLGREIDTIESDAATILDAAIVCAEKFPECRGGELEPSTIFRYPTAAFINGEPVLRKYWQDPVPEGTTIEFNTLMAGGGDGNKGTIFSAVSIIVGAVLVMTGWGAPLGYGLIASGLIGLASSALMPEPETPDLSQDLGSSSPTYSQYARNRRQPGRPVPVRYGKTKAAPDLACSAWSTWETKTEDSGDVEREMYEALLVLGQGVYDIEDVLLGNQPITDILHGEVTVFAPGQTTTNTSIDREVSIDVQGIELEAMGTKQQTMTIAWNTDSRTIGAVEEEEEIFNRPFNPASISVWTASTAWSADQAFTNPSDSNIIYMVKTGFTTAATFLEADILVYCRKFDTGPGSLLWAAIDGDVLAANNTPFGSLADNTIGELTESDTSEIVFQRNSGAAWTCRWDWVVWRIVVTQGEEKCTWILTCSSPPFSNQTTSNHRSGYWNNVVTNSTCQYPSSGLDKLSYSYITLNRRMQDITSVWTNISLPQGLFRIDSNGDRQSVAYEYFVVLIMPNGYEWITNYDASSGKFIEPMGWSDDVPWTANWPGSPGADELVKVIAYRIFDGYTDVAQGVDRLSWDHCRVVCARPELNSATDESLSTTRIHVKFPLKNSTQQLVDLIRVISTRKVPTYNGTIWSTDTATREISWAIADMLKNTTYGLGLDDSAFDLDELYSLHSYWSITKSWKFDMSYDTRQDRWKALETAAASGLAKTLLIGGTPSWWADKPTTTRTVLFDQKNIVAGSFVYEVQTPDEDDFDGTEVMYIKQDSFSTETFAIDYQGNTPSNPEKMTLLGVTEKLQAQSIARAYANSLQYRRELISFETGLEGYLPSFGTLVPVQHSMPEWGVTAECVSQISSTVWLLERDLPWGTGTHKVLIRDREGQAHGPYIVTEITSAIVGISTEDLPKLIEFAEPPPFAPETDRTLERSHVVFGEDGETFVDIIVTSITPSGSHKVKITGVIYKADAFTGV